MAHLQIVSCSSWVDWAGPGRLNLVEGDREELRIGPNLAIE